jgi:tRNA wybutosine-synthesizing protein 2
MIPKSFQALGDICLIKIKDHHVGEHILKKFPRFRSVYYQGKISGKLRKPNVEWLAGERNPVTMVKENFCEFVVDISRVMFSKGNQEEKRRIVNQIQSGEEILDMFAGIGYFTIPVARLSGAKKVWAVELNPDAVELLKQNIELNHVLHKVKVIQGDSKKIVPELGQKFDRILMGYFPGTYEFLPAALEVARKGAIIHFHEIAEDSQEIISKIKEINPTIEILKTTKVKGYGIRTWHWVIDFKRP